MDNTFIAALFDWDHRTPTLKQAFINKIFKKFRLPFQLTPTPPDMATIEARINLFHLLDQTIAFNIPGDIIDVGCNAGDSTVVMQKLACEYAPQKQVHAYDSFAGLPELSQNDLNDGIYGKGYMIAKLDEFKKKFDDIGLPQPQVHKGWFEETVPEELPEKISFALIDGDLYESTKHILPHIYERMSPGAIAVIAVYYDEDVFPRKDLDGCYRSPGVKRLCDEFFADKPEKVSVLYAGEYTNGYFRKQ